MHALANFFSTEAGDVVGEWPNLFWANPSCRNAPKTIPATDVTPNETGWKRKKGEGFPTSQNAPRACATGLPPFAKLVTEGNGAGRGKKGTKEEEGCKGRGRG